MVKRLDDSLEGCAAAGEVWQLYRRILGFYSHHGKFQPVAPPAPASSSGLNPPMMLSAGGSNLQAAAASTDVAVAAFSEAATISSGQGDNVFDRAGGEGSLDASAAGALGVAGVDGATSAVPSVGSSSVETRPMSPAARLQGAAALLARPGSPLQPVASRGASGNLSSSSANRSSAASPQQL
jgi:hypothetical protein